MIKVKIIDLINSTETLQKLSQKDFKAKLAWSIARLLKAAEKEIQDFMLPTKKTHLNNKYRKILKAWERHSNLTLIQRNLNS